MKFSDLTSAQRSILTALRSTSSLNTERLGLACVPQNSPTGAAGVLVEMRTKGLVHSIQKPESQRFALWCITEYGMAVFDGRPDTDPALAPMAVVTAASPPTPDPKVDVAAKSEPVKSFLLFKNRSMEGQLTATTREAALDEAQQRATASPGNIYTVFEEVARAELPKPQAQITLL